MATAAVCGPANSAPGFRAGPFGTGEDAAGWIAGRLAGAGRYMAAAEPSAPQDVC